MQRESVWDYPRPASCERFEGRLKVIVHSVVLADTIKGYRTLETSHPPSYYFPPGDVAMDQLVANGYRTFCEWKGEARYFDLHSDGQIIRNVAWSYPQPSAAFEHIRDHLSFYASRVEACYVNDERVQAQEGDFYGGWITANLVGPFKGAPGTTGW